MPDAREVQRTFKKGFKPDDPEIWSDFLDRFGKSEGRICYYPSAGSDFRPVIYQHLSGMAKLGFVDTNGDIPKPGSELFEHSSYSAPDLWILSDFRGDHLTEWLETKLVHSDKKAEIRMLAHTEMHPQRMDFQQRPSPAYTSLPPTEMTGRVFYLRLAITNETIGTVEVDVIYFCVENVNLIRSFLLRQHIPLSHLVWVRDGAGFGGGRMRHDFLIPLLTLFETRWLFIGEGYHQNPGEARWPKELLFHKRMLAGQVPDLHALGSFQSGDDRVVFCEVDSARVHQALKKLRRQMIERRIQEEQNKPKPSVYLWLCCEGWMKFGPFEWLRFDKTTSTISESTGKVIAWREGVRWFVASGSGAGMAFDENYMITTSARHPDPYNHNTPRIKPLTPPSQKQKAGQAADSPSKNDPRFSKEDWERYFDTAFERTLRAVSEAFHSDSDCEHCRAPNELRVQFPKMRVLRDLVPNSQQQLFLGCWYGLLIVSQGLHRFYCEAHARWQSSVFCPLPVHPIGMGCVRVSPSRQILKEVQFQPELWDSFILFFRERLLADVERISGVEPRRLMEKVRNDRLRQDDPLSWNESKFFRD